MKLEVNNSKRSADERLRAIRYNELTTYTSESAETGRDHSEQYHHYQRHPFTKYSGCETKSWRVQKLFEGAEQRMAEYCCLRSMLTLLHVCMGIAAGFYSVYAIVGEGYNLQCLPPLVDHFGDAVPFINGLPELCYSVLYAMIGVCVISFLMAVCINCCWENACTIFTNLTFTVIVGAISVFGGTAFTVHYMLWCDSLSQSMTRSHLGCKESAKSFDKTHHSTNMTLYYTKLEIQQMSLWVIFPFALMAVVFYASAIYITAVQDSKGQSVRGYVILQEEATPLITSRSATSAVQEQRNPCSPPDYSSTGPAVVDIHSDQNVNENGSRSSPTPSAPVFGRSPPSYQNNPFTTSRSA